MTGWIIAGCILLAIALLLCIPVCVSVEYDGSFSASVSYAFLKWRVFPAKPKKAKTKKKKPPKKEEKPEEKKPLSEKLKKLKKEVETIIELLRSVKGPLKFLLGRLKLYLLELRIVVAGEDAHKTGETYGMICAAAYPLIFELRKIKTPKKQIVGIRPEFCEEKGSVLARLKLGIAPWAVIASVIGMAVNYIGILIKKLFRKTGNAAGRQLSAAAARRK